MQAVIDITWVCDAYNDFSPDIVDDVSVVAMLSIYHMVVPPEIAMLVRLEFT